MSTGREIGVFEQGCKDIATARNSNEQMIPGSGQISAGSAVILRRQLTVDVDRVGVYFAVISVVFAAVARVLWRDVTVSRIFGLL